jgi:hypothetical protein
MNTLLPQEDNQGKEEAYTRSSYLNSYFTFVRYSFEKELF